MPKLETKPVGFFKTAKQVRDVHQDDELRSLGESLKVRQLQAIIAKPDGLVIAGHRRLAAAILVGKPTLDVIITDEALSDSQIRGIQLEENIHRADLTGHEKWQACKELLELNAGWNGKDLAGHLHLDPSSVTRLLSPEKCIAEAQAALRDGKITISDCYAISKLAPEDQPGLLALKLEGASRDELERKGRAARNTAKNGDTDTAKVERLPVALSAGTVIIKAKKGEEALNLAAAKVLLVEALAKVDCAIKMGYSTKTAVHAWDETKHNVRTPRKPKVAKNVAAV
jgi:ParB/RepB/Spo0J family partition protein